MTTTYLDPKPLLEVLIAGLGVTSRALGTQCEAALRAMGGLVVPYLEDAAAEASPPLRKRLKKLASTIGESPQKSPDASPLLWDTLLLAAAAKTRQPIGALIPALRQLGPNMIDALAAEACSNRKKPDVCVRLLRVIEQLGGLRTVNALREIRTLMTSGDFAVRMVAVELFLGSPLAPATEGAGWSEADAMRLAFAFGSN